MFFAILVGAGMLVVSLVVYAMVNAMIAHVVVRPIRAGHTPTGFWLNVALMVAVSFITATAHLIQIALWAVVLLMVGEVSDFDKAFYCSAQNYTALGYGDVLLSERWRMLGPLESINGLLLFGLSTAAMFAVMSRLITSRLHFDADR
jgi:hypothetical protein